MAVDPLAHSGHDFSHLMERWCAFVESADWTRTILNRDGSLPVIALENAVARENKAGGIYLSAGVHGDECAPPWALLAWAESQPKIFETIPVTLCPCLNPKGLIENRRDDGTGLDLNRHFQDGSHPLIGAWHEFLGERQFEVAVNLHEDYDTSGIYLYEITSQNPVGHALLDAVESVIPREPSGEVDGSVIERGLLAHRGSIQPIIDEHLDGGWPEAIYLAQHHTALSFTFETPSEAALERRVEAHRLFIEAVVSNVVEPSARSDLS